MKFDYCKNCTQKPLPMSRELFETIIKQPWLESIANDVANGSLERKRDLPAACWQASFGGEKRSNQTAIHSGLFALDIDHIDNPLALYNRFKARISELGIYIVHKTPSTKGLRIVAACREGLTTIGENQEWIAKEIGVEHDAVTRDFARLSFLVPESYFYHYNPKIFTDTAKVVLENSSHKTPAPASRNGVATLMSPASVPLSNTPAPQSPYPADYDGIPYTVLVETLTEQLGGVPVHGSRNNFLFSMACHLRYVCNDDARWISSILPTFGEERSRMERTVQSAVNRAQSRQMPALVQRAISVARTKAIASNPMSSCQPPPLPEKLPRLIQLLVSKVDPMYRPAVAQAVFPPLGAHLHGVRVHYIDNSVADLGGFMAVLLAKQSIGKGAVNQPIDAIMEDIRDRDEYNRDQEVQWKKQCKSAKANEKKPPRPEGLCIQYLMSNMTNAALVQRLVDAQKAGDRFLYVKVDELEQLDQIKATGGATASEIIRLAFTQSLYGQERVGTESVTGTPPLRFNFNASSTVHTGQAYFAKGLTNGTLSRLTFATIIKPEGKRGIPRFGNYDEQFRNELSPFIQNLNNASGLIECQQAEEMAQRLCERNEELAELSDDEEFETLSYRANRICFDKAMLLYIADGCQWSQEIADFCEWSNLYDLWCKMHFFGKQMREAVQTETTVSLPGVQNMLELLPDRFCREDVIALRRAQGKDANANHALAVWTNRGYIAQDSSTQEYVKTAAYRSRGKR